jgi:hypothetical protein
VGVRSWININYEGSIGSRRASYTMHHAVLLLPCSDIITLLVTAAAQSNLATHNKPPGGSCHTVKYRFAFNLKIQLQLHSHWRLVFPELDEPQLAQHAFAAAPAGCCILRLLV